MQLAETVTFGASGLDRAAALRGQPERIAELLQQGQVLALWRGQVPVDSGNAAGGLVWVPPGSRLLDHAGPPVFLGLDDGIPRFAADISAWTPAIAPQPPGGIFSAEPLPHPALPDTAAFQDLRTVMATLSPRQAELAATGKAIIGWHASHGFCASCGVASAMDQAGWRRLCPACGAQHFPRTDPVVIMVIERNGRLLLGRSPGWPEGMYSLLAGFVEPGETLEAAVRREVAEETGVTVGTVRYLASQPWPFPASLMLGAHGQAKSDAITLDPAELEDALWVTKDDMVTILAGHHPRIRAGRAGAIAHFLIRHWVADSLD
ncbi:NAD(+) diphosphatase [Fuscibacter oryzae]|uniref:NAD(+) diphosphatase n=1 Tax=Fuscibacter oryzae TaxID=2803939 RepID=A0A8J7SUB0_9RHOB|nr:NAD(+) diphosphatase [Fuscibacter oryzae]MBL4926559.1 NAD(+) diphosphatase [Fuscibacter oryzae]